MSDPESTNGRPDLPLWVFHRSATREAATRLLKAGFEAYLLKPLFYDALPDTLDRLLWMPPEQ